MVPLTILKLSLITFTMGARQLVVHDAFEMMLCLAGSYLSWFTPRTMVTSSFFAGAEMTTFLTGPRRCFLASSALVNLPVDSITTCTPTDSHGRAAGSFSLKTLMVLPSTVMLSAPALTWFDRLPRTESYFRRWASVLGSVRSLTATNSRLGSFKDARRTLRPMRPKPLMPTLIAMKPPYEMNDCAKMRLLGKQMMLSVQARHRKSEL